MHNASDATNDSNKERNKDRKKGEKYRSHSNQMRLSLAPSFEIPKSIIPDIPQPSVSSILSSPSTPSVHLSWRSKNPFGKQIDSSEYFYESAPKNESTKLEEKISLINASLRKFEENIKQNYQAFSVFINWLKELDDGQFILHFKTRIENLIKSFLELTISNQIVDETQTNLFIEFYLDLNPKKAVEFSQDSFILLLLNDDYWSLLLTRSPKFDSSSNLGIMDCFSSILNDLINDLISEIKLATKLDIHYGYLIHIYERDELLQDSEEPNEANIVSYSCFQKQLAFITSQKEAIKALNEFKSDWETYCKAPNNNLKLLFDLMQGLKKIKENFFYQVKIINELNAGLNGIKEKNKDRTDLNWIPNYSKEKVELKLEILMAQFSYLSLQLFSADENDIQQILLIFYNNACFLFFLLVDRYQQNLDDSWCLLLNNLYMIAESWNHIIQKKNHTKEPKINYKNCKVETEADFNNLSKDAIHYESTRLLNSPLLRSEEY